MDDSDSSSLSSAPDEEVQKLAPIFARAKKATKLKAPPPKESPPRPKRDPSPPHEDVFADNPDIAFLVMFRSRFAEQLPAKLAHLGPQDVERGVIENPPSPQVEALLCSVLALVLNRTKPVEKGHYGRAMEEAFLKHKGQWPRRWQGINPLRGSMDFNSLGPLDRLDVLRTLILWSLSSSDILRAKIQEAYKQSRHNDDENQGLSVQPWGQDGDKRRYYLIEGQDDTAFRVYREGPRNLKATPQWYSIAGDIDELRALASKLEQVDGTQAARRLAGRMLAAVPRFEQSEEKRKRREQRQARRAAFSRPEPGFSLYEGRTRGKRMRYTYDDDEEDTLDSDATSARKSTRQQSNRSTPFEPGPTFTSSGRQVRGRTGGTYGESKLSNQITSTDELAPEYEDQVQDYGSENSDPVRNGRRSTRNAGRGTTGGDGGTRKRKRGDGRNNIDEMSDEDEATPSGDEWDGGDDDDDQDATRADADDKDDDSEVEVEEEEDEEPSSLVVKLHVNGAARTREDEGSEETSSPTNDGNVLSSPGCEGAGSFEAQQKKSAKGLQHEQKGETSTHGVTKNQPDESASVFVSAEKQPKMYWEAERTDGMHGGAHTASAGMVGYQ